MRCFLKAERRSTRAVVRQCFSCRAGRSAKDWLDPAGDKGRPKVLYAPFLHESLQLSLEKVHVLIHTSLLRQAHQFYLTLKFYTNILWLPSLKIV